MIGKYKLHVPPFISMLKKNYPKIAYYKEWFLHFVEILFYVSSFFYWWGSLAIQTRDII